ncbi:hypothetical protein D3C78_640330 [compost metagenome]
MPAELRAERVGHLTLRSVVHLLAELRHQRLRVDPVEVAAVQRRAWVFREALGQCAEVFAGLDAVVETLRQALGFRVAANLAGLEQDVADMDFVADHPAAATLFFHLDDDEAARGADRFGDFADGQRADHAVERRRQLGGLAPADLAAFQGVVAGGVGDRHLAEVGALA